MKNPVSLFLATTLAWCPLAFAAEPGAAIPVSAQQMQALGITVQPLKRGAASGEATVPARVVLPPGGELVASAPVSGLAVQVYVQPNQSVAKGAALVRIASPELGTLQLNLMQAASRAALAQRTVERERALFGEGIVAQRRLQEAEAVQAEARAALSQARSALRLAGMAPGAIERVAAGGKPDDSITVAAAASGVVTKVEVRPGQRVDASTALVGLARLDRLVLEIEVPAADAAHWPAGAQVGIQGRKAKAVVKGTSPLVSAQTQTTTVRAELAGGADVRPGELVAVQVPQGAAGNGWDVPLAAVAHVGKQGYVFVRTSSGFEARPVSELGSAGQQVRVAGALKEGDSLAVSGVVALKGEWQRGKGGQ
ncbi:efflux RND transporter periplasmic adaptor subunit [Massilia agilis]|uniref:Efflux RND transporter periplasmic adaptor subunit n=1 Tax=Massilia agilis TaxID=1811226 RepID=A0ABT2D4V3_9BURK|nr:efflux RND transporter periplasmic adaptor subunit [Massilia agilis]MCS0806334.1 efflux RND transporter periplasmic adaptor subunit [Massilia agilis]